MHYIYTHAMCVLCIVTFVMVCIYVVQNRINETRRSSFLIINFIMINDSTHAYSRKLGTEKKNESFGCYEHHFRRTFARINQSSFGFFVVFVRLPKNISNTIPHFMTFLLNF